MITGKFFIRIFLLVALAGLGSCVSTKKYNAAINERDQKYRQLQASYDQLNKDKLNAESSAYQSQKQNATALENKDKALNEERKRLEELNSMIVVQRNAIRNLKQEVCSALKCFSPDELSIEVRDGKLYVSLSDKLLFPSGSDVVNARGQEAISMLAAVLANSDLEIMVEGHTDNVPISSARNKDNWDLSVHRASNVTRLFIENGIKPERIIASGRGEFHPMDTNETASGRQSNRRTEIVLAPKLDKLWKLTEDDNASSSMNR